MATDLEFEDAVKICEFYSSYEYPIHVDWDARYIELGDDEYVVNPICEEGDHMYYIIKDPSGTRKLVCDIDDYFQSMLPDWRCEL